MIAATPQARTPQNPQVAIWTFVALTFGWTWGLWAAVSLIGPSAPRLSGVLFLASAFGPGVAAFVTLLFFQGKVGFARWLKRCLHWRLGWGWYALALFAAPLAMGTALGLHFALGGTIPPMPVQGPVLIIVAQFVVITVFGGPLGEEFGWRGYALPTLMDLLGWRWAAILIGVIWGLWHLPLFWIPGAAQAELPMALFLASTVALSVVFARLSVNTQFSVLPAILLHGAINWSSLVLPIMPAGGDTRPYTIVMGLVMLIAVAVVLKPGPHPAVAEHSP
ncbi:CPBP family intramembrane glutamic endopeptidase [Roseovarius sp.]|uniref:CPBP family intramembrane glutamic endopeptidase n=1 Tax=Roseovarius sp. TaxID=1486281 RepID=UPI003565080A